MDHPEKDAVVKELVAIAKQEVAEGTKSLGESLEAVNSRLDELGLAVKNAGSEAADMIKGLRDEQAKREEKGQGFNWVKAMRGAKTGNWTEAGFEKEIHEQVQKANATNPDSAGGYIVPTELWMDEYVEILKSKTFMDAAGVRQISLAGRGDMEIPMQAGVITASWIGENTAGTETDISFAAPLVLKPKTLMGATRYSKKVLNQTGGNIDRLIKQDLFEQMVLKLESDLLYGNGVNPIPLGLKNVAGLAGTIAGTDGSTITYDMLMNLIGYVEDNNVGIGNAKFVSSPAFYRTLRKLKDTTGTPLFNPVLSQDPLDYWFGYKGLASTLVNSTVTKGTATSKTGEVFFGDFSNIIVGTWQGLTIEASDIAGNAFLQNQVIIKATGEYDIGNRRPGAFAMISDAIVR